MILLHVAMSLDGFIAGPAGDMSWTSGAEYDTSSPLADEVASATGGILAGRGWYDVASADEGGAVAGIYGGAWSGPVVVVTHDPDALASVPGIEAASNLDHGLPRAQQLAATSMWASLEATWPVRFSRVGSWTRSSSKSSRSCSAEVYRSSVREWGHAWPLNAHISEPAAG